MPMAHRSRLAATATIIAVVAACGAQPSPSPSASPAPPRPTASPSPTSTAPAEPVVAQPPGDLYDVPDPLPAGRPGDLVWAERVAAPEGAIAWRVLYRSETIAGVPIGVSGLVVAPDRNPPDGGWPVIGYAHGTTGLADHCAPSKAATPTASGEE